MPAPEGAGWRIGGGGLEGESWYVLLLIMTVVGTGRGAWFGMVETRLGGLGSGESALGRVECPTGDGSAVERPGDGSVGTEAIWELGTWSKGFVFVGVGGGSKADAMGWTKVRAGRVLALTNDGVACSVLISSMVLVKKWLTWLCTVTVAPGIVTIEVWLVIDVMVVSIVVVIVQGMQLDCC